MASSKVIEIIVDVADKTGGKLNGLKEQLLSMDRTVERMNAKIKKMAAARYQATLNLIDRVTSPASRVNALLKRLAGKVYNIVLRVNDAVTNKIRELEAKLMRLAGRAWTIAVNVKDNIKGKFGGFLEGAAMGAGIFAPMAGAAGIGYGVANGLQAYMEFEKQMSRVQSIRELDKNSPQMIQLVEQAKELGATTAWTRKEVGEAQYYQALAGWEVPQILKSTPHLLNLASASGADLKSTSDIVTDAMTGFQLKATDEFINSKGHRVNAVEHFTDMFAKLQASSNTDAYQAGEAFKYSSNIIGSMYANIGGQEGVQKRMEATRDAMAMVGLMANAGIKGSMAGTGVTNIFNRMASMNRNASRALEAMGVEYKDENGNLLMPAQIMRSLSKRFKEGVDPNQLMEFAEAISGEKIQADTRRKLESFLEQTMKNGGKMGSADMMKMSSMLGGAEHMGKLMAVVLGDIDAMLAKLDDVEGTSQKMADTQLNNLSGDLIRLGSAWDAFQQSFFEGQAGEGLRNFTQALTDVVTRANELFKDGIDISDIGKVVGDVIGRLKNKFLELDGVGSVLAGGALMAGLVKIASTLQKVFGYFKNLRGLQIGSRLGGIIPPTAKPPTGLPGAFSVSTMHVSAGVVNISGRVSNGVSGGTGGVNGGGRRVGDRTIIDRYNRERERIRGAGSSSSTASRWAGMKSAAKGGAAFAAIFGALDFFSTRSMSADRLAEANEELALAQREYKEQLSQGATQDVLADYTKRIADAQQNQLAVMKANRVAEAESLGGATGAVIGTALGAAIGSLIGPVGTMVGGIIGGMAGDYVGTKTAKWGIEREEAIRSTAKADVSTDTIAKYAPGTKELKEIERQTNPPGAFDEITMTTKKKLMPWLTDREANYFGYNGEDLLKPADSWWGGKKNQPSWYEFSLTPPKPKHEETIEEWIARQQAETDRIVADSQRRQLQNLQSKWSPSLSDNQSWQPFNAYDEGQAALKRYEASGKQATTATSSLTDKLKEFAPSMEKVMAATFPALGALFAPLDELLFSKASAAKLPEGQVPTPETPKLFGEEYGEMMSATPGFAGDKINFDEMLNFDSIGEKFSELREMVSEGLSGAMEGVGEFFSSMAETVSEGFSSLLEGAGEIFSEFGEMISEGLTVASEIASEIISTLGETISEGITTALTTAGEMFASFGELVSSGLAAAQGAAESALAAIGAAFESTKAMIMGAWGELPGFFSGIFSTLGGVAAAAGSAIYSGLTSVIGAVIGAWQSAAATVSSIIASISAAASSVASMIPSFGGGGGGGGAFAEGGFVTSPTQALVGEAGAEVIIPLNASKRSRALELFEKTAGILGGDALNIGGDKFQKEFGSELAEDAPYSTNAFEGLSTDESITPETPKTGKTEISLGGVTMSFSFNGVENIQDFMEQVKSNASDVADIVASKLARAIEDISNNQPLEG